MTALRALKRRDYQGTLKKATESLWARRLMRVTDLAWERHPDGPTGRQLGRAARIKYGKYQSVLMGICEMLPGDE